MRDIDAAIPPFADLGITVLERGWLSSNNVLLASPDAAETVLIDSGYVSHAPQTLALVRSVLAGRPLDRIVNTHLHSDHCGGNALLQQTFQCGIDVPVGEAAKVDAWDEQALTYIGTGQRCARFRRTGVIAPGDTIEHGNLRWTALAAPGHDPESIVLHEADLGAGNVARRGALSRAGSPGPLRARRCADMAALAAARSRRQRRIARRRRDGFRRLKRKNAPDIHRGRFRIVA